MPPKKAKASSKITPLSEAEFYRVAELVLPPDGTEYPAGRLRKYDEMKKEIPNLAKRFEEYLKEVIVEDEGWRTLLPEVLHKLHSYDKHVPLSRGLELTFPPNVFDDPFPATPFQPMGQDDSGNVDLSLFDDIEN